MVIDMNKSKIEQVVLYTIGIILCLSIAFQMYHYNQFVSSVNNFIARDSIYTIEGGRELCNRIIYLEKTLKECNYIKKEVLDANVQ